jgi:hypothetical protein
MHNHELLSHQQWTALRSLKSLVDKHMSGADAQALIEAALEAKSRTQTDFRSLDVLAIFCTVRLFIKCGDLMLTYVSHQLVTNCLCIPQREER